MRTAYFLIVCVLAGLSFLCSKNHPIGPEDPPDEVPCDTVFVEVQADTVFLPLESVEGRWLIRIKHTTSAPDEYELRQNAVQVFYHKFTEPGNGEFVSFEIPATYHPGDVISAFAKKSRSEIHFWFEAN